MPRHAAHRRQPRTVVRIATVLALLAVSTAAGAADPPLHERIDLLIESASIGPVAPPANDADFLRRVYLDLNGTIPSVPSARSFLDDPAANKREALVDRLLARPQFARHIQNVFNVMLLERRPEKGIPAAEWQEYLRKSFADNKPLDQLAREILAADGVEPGLRPAAKFYLDREGDSNLLARDIGRLFFGRDFQCAQCHDHPLIDDYLQADYYGLMAFVSRGVLFTDKEKKIFYAETADGEVSYKSVFTGDARDHVVPKLPQAAAVSEPQLTKEEQYVVAPDKEVRPVPKYSRRAQLAALATGGSNSAFNRNLANRLWAQMMGRGLIHPLDFEHSGNPSVQAELLALLADELVKMKFDAKAFVRELALTRAYQRSSDMPDPANMKLDLGSISPLVGAWSAEAQRLTDELTGLQAASVNASAGLSAAYENFSKGATARDVATKAGAEAKKASDETAASLAAAIKDVAAKEEVLKLLTEARDKTQAAVAKLADDKALAEAAGQFKSRAEQVDGQLAAARKTVGERTAQMQAASLKIAEVDKALQTAAAEVTAARVGLDAADTVARAALDNFRAAKARQRELTARVADAQAALAYQTVAAAASASQSAAQVAVEQLAAAKTQTATTVDQLAQFEQAAQAAAEKATADRTARDQAWNAAVDRATVRFTLAPLKGLSPEQLAWATMQAVGMVDAQTAALESQAKKDALALANLNDDQRAQAEAGLLEKAVDEKLRDNIVPFVSLFGQQPGQAPSFQATVHQALFIANGGLLGGWINPTGNNLTERLAKIDQAGPLADELYLAVLSRRPTAEEQAQAAAYWTAGGADRAATVREMVWSLLSSAEFRFNH
jgi:hypothetical protein